jgi:invasion protein IalB
VQQLFQRIPNQGDRLLAAVLVRRPADPKAAPQMTMQLPLGLNLTEPVQVNVDGGAPERQPVEMSLPLQGFGLAFDRIKP